MKEVFIFDAKRTAIGSYLGAVSSVSAIQLGSDVIKHIVTSKALDTSAIDEVILGQVLTAGLGQNPARQCIINSGLDVSTCGFTIGKVCGSGMKAVGLAFDAIALGHANLVLAGGQESMSQSCHAIMLRNGIKMGNANLVDLMMHDGLTDIFSNVAMGITAENIAKEMNISRDEQDKFAHASQAKAAKAQSTGTFKDEIVPIIVKNKKGDVVFESDEFIKHDTSIESLGKLRPAFLKDGTVTAGNASGINDGASILLIGSADAAKKYNLKPIAKIVSYASAGVRPDIMGVGPAYAVPKALKLASWNIDDLELIEANEAFAVQAIAVNRILNWNTDIINVNGGAIALGHPIGASGARVITTLVHEMRKRKVKQGLATLCIGGGMGIAMCIEGVE